MINQMHKLLNKVEKGFDPVPEQYSEVYSESQFRQFSKNSMEIFDEYNISLENKEVLDLGGGPGQYTIGMAKRGGDVTWHDISRNYKKIIEEKVKEEGLVKKVKYSLGYLEDVKGEYDVIFNRICWCYCVSDQKFAKLIFDRLKSGGEALLIVNTTATVFVKESFEKNKRFKKMITKFKYFIYRLFNIKIGHLMPYRGKVIHAITKWPFSKIYFTNYNGGNLIIYLKK